MTASMRQVAYERIRNLLLRGDVPPGTHLSARALGKQLGMSLIPVREAIGQLAHEGLVDHLPGRGAFVHWPTAKELEDLYEIREALECHALRMAGRDMAPDAIAAMRRCHATLEDIAGSTSGQSLGSDEANRWVRADAELHLTLLRATGNQRMVDLVGNLRIMAQVFGRGQRGHTDSPDNRSRICGEHQCLIDALESGDVERARSVLSSHIRTGLGEAKRLLAERMLAHGQDRAKGAVLLEGGGDIVDDFPVPDSPG